MTLIEVLIALAIISIAMIAVIKSSSQNIRGTYHLQHKTIATWVGQEIVNEIRTDLIRLPRNGEIVKRMTVMLGNEWYWQARQTTTPNPHIKKVEVNVYNAPHEDDDGASPAASLEGYFYHA